MITQEQRFARWERILRRCYEAEVRESREVRDQTKKLKLYLDATNQWFAARRALDELPEDLGRKEELLKATHVLDQAREELRRTLHFS
jgi:hypothetical protein